MNAAQLIAEYNALGPSERQKVAEAVLADDSWIPESFAKGMKDIETGRVT